MRTEDGPQASASVGRLGLADLFGRSASDDFASVGPAFRADVDDPVCSLDDVEVVFDHDDAVACIDELAQYGQ